MTPYHGTSTSAASGVAVNTIVVHRDKGRFVLEGDNTDVAGFLAPLSDLNLRGRSVAVLGAGGAARAVLYGLIDTCKPARIDVCARRVEQATDLVLGRHGTPPVLGPLRGVAQVDAEILIRVCLGVRGRLGSAAKTSLKMAASKVL